MLNIGITGDYNVYCDVEVYENPDWGYARNKHVLIRDILLEYSTSSFDAAIITSLGVLHGGNRDFSWQGLLAGPINDELYRLLDALYYKPLDADNLKPLFVRVQRNSASYIYVDERGRHYGINITVAVKEGFGVLTAYASRPSIFAPLLDVRNAESNAQPNYNISFRENNLIVESDAAPLKLRVVGFEEAENLDEWLEWTYKLGDGFRTIENGKLKFIKQRRKLYLPATLTANKGFIRIEIPLPATKPQRCDARIERKAKLMRILNAPPRVFEAIMLRIDRLLSFNTVIDSLLAPGAGAMWFRRVWARDLLEGIRWNLRTYILLGLSEWLINMVRALIKISYEAGGLRTLIWKGDYSSDAFPQLINVATLIYRLTGNASVVKEAAKLMIEAYRRLMSGESYSGYSLYDGLLVCRANSSWIDTVYSSDGVKWPARLPWDWRERVSSENQFALVEVNALFLECLDNLMNSLKELKMEVPVELAEFRDMLLDGYKRWFMNAAGLPPMTIEPKLDLKDETKSSVGVVALAALKNIVYGKSLLNSWRDINQLLVKRKLMDLGDTWEPFGLLVRKGEVKPYLDDLEYHWTVVWPRDTPYLIEVMKHLSMDVYGLLINNLDHMISEGAIGYVNELFSMPVGRNPCPRGEESLNPVPVKNFAQYWSHWCDPYINYFSMKR